MIETLAKPGRGNEDVAPPMHEVLQVPLKSGHKRVTDSIIYPF